jgi:hypothetical protein
LPPSENTPLAAATSSLSNMQLTYPARWPP